MYLEVCCSKYNCITNYPKPSVLRQSHVLTSGICTGRTVKEGLSLSVPRTLVPQ